VRTFSIHTLGCKVNQYESEQIAAVLRSRGLVASEGADADLRIINTCAVTTEATSKSRQVTRRATRLPVLGAAPAKLGQPKSNPGGSSTRVIVTGCWATSDRESASRIDGVDAVLTHHDDVAKSLNSLLDAWLEPTSPTHAAGSTDADTRDTSPKLARNDGWIIAGERFGPRVTQSNKSQAGVGVKENLGGEIADCQLPIAECEDVAHGRHSAIRPGTTSLPLLSTHSSEHARAFVKIQDGCDAHCTYCIIPRLRSALWSKPVGDVIAEAQALVDAGHREIVLTGIFLGAYGHETALRRRQSTSLSAAALAQLASALCSRVAGLQRLRFSSLEPMDLTDELIAVLRDLPQVVPHFHLPLQSGSVAILRKMNRQYGREDFLRMLDRVHAAFDRPALTTDIICGFPGETEAEFQQTLDIARRAGFIHIHAFPFSPRPGTAAARWKGDFVPGAAANARIQQLRQLAAEHSFAYRSQFIGQAVQVLVERPDETARALGLQHGRCERYFDVHFESPDLPWGQAVDVRIDRITRTRTFGSALTSSHS
jgi:MiaB/RimO family radical SAM methylthiotransferase